MSKSLTTSALDFDEDGVDIDAWQTADAIEVNTKSMSNSNEWGIILSLILIFTF